MKRRERGFLQLKKRVESSAALLIEEEFVWVVVVLVFDSVLRVHHITFYFLFRLPG